MNKFYSLILLIALGSTTNAAFGKTFDELRQAEKLALSLTGKPLSDKMRSDFLEGKVELGDLAESLSKNTDFIEKFAQFWTVAMNIKAPIDHRSLRRKSDGAMLLDIPSRSSFADLTVPGRCGEKTKDQMTNWLRDRENATPQLVENTDCDDIPILVQRHADSDLKQLQEIVNTGKCTDGTPIKEGTAPLWSRINDLVKESAPACGSTSGQIVQPWWDPNHPSAKARYKNAPGYRVADRVIRLCGGPTLPKCDVVHATAIDSFRDKVGSAMTLEPGRIISHVVAEDKPYASILTTSETIINGPYAYFIDKGIGRELNGNYVGAKSYPNRDVPAFTEANADNMKHYWVDRGEHNAGVLTTIGFQMSTNGRRAMANRTLQSFLCTALAVPANVPIDDTDSNPDLTQRRYCSACHKMLEPMAAFFNRWPDTGANNFLYDTDASISDRGKFNDKEGSGALGLGKIVIEDPEFGKCAIKRAFEFVNGRKMSETEKETLIPEFHKIYESSQGRLRPVIKSMVLHKNFLTQGK